MVEAVVLALDGQINSFARVAVSHLYKFATLVEVDEFLLPNPNDVAEVAVSELEAFLFQEIFRGLHQTDLIADELVDSVYMDFVTQHV